MCVCVGLHIDELGGWAENECEGRRFGMCYCLGFRTCQKVNTFE